MSDANPHLRKMNMKKRTGLLTIATIALISTSAFAGCGSQRSSPSSQPADVKFTNATKTKVNVLWYKFKGGTRKYRVLAPSQSYVQATYTNHIWAFTDRGGKCLSTYVVRGSSNYTIQ